MSDPENAETLQNTTIAPTDEQRARHKAEAEENALRREAWNRPGWYREQVQARVPHQDEAETRSYARSGDASQIRDYHEDLSHGRIVRSAPATLMWFLITSAFEDLAALSPETKREDLCFPCYLELTTGSMVEGVIRLGPLAGTVIVTSQVLGENKRPLADRVNEQAICVEHIARFMRIMQVTGPSQIIRG